MNYTTSDPKHQNTSTEYAIDKTSWWWVHKPWQTAVSLPENKDLPLRLSIDVYREILQEIFFQFKDDVGRPIKNPICNLKNFKEKAADWPWIRSSTNAVIIGIWQGCLGGAHRVHFEHFLLHDSVTPDHLKFGPRLRYSSINRTIQYFLFCNFFCSNPEARCQSLRQINELIN